MNNKNLRYFNFYAVKKNLKGENISHKIFQNMAHFFNNNKHPFNFLTFSRLELFYSRRNSYTDENNINVTIKLESLINYSAMISLYILHCNSKIVNRLESVHDLSR